MASIKCGHCKDTHSSVQEVRECSQHPGTMRDYGYPGPLRPPGTLRTLQEELQRMMEGPLFCGHIDKAGDLCGEPVELTAGNEPTHEDRLINLEHDVLTVSQGQLAKLHAGKSLDGAQLKKTQERREQRSDPVTEGWYKVDDTIYKVQRAVHGSGNLYAKELVVHGHGDASWEYARGAIRRIRGHHRLSMEEAQEFGKLYGVCVRCGLTLTKEESIARGMGDVCAGKGL